MKDDQPPRSVSSSAWTGPPPETPHSGINRGFRPRLDPIEQRTQTVAGLLLAGCLMAFVIWYVVLGSHSSVAPSPATGQTEALSLFSRRGPPIYVTPTEALITYALLVAAFAVPVAYLLGSEALCGRFKR